MNFVEFLNQLHGKESPFRDRYGDWLGYDIDNVDRENFEVITKLPIRDDHLSPSGAVHGGVISGFLDFSCGLAAFSSLSKGELCSTVELNVKYFRPVKSGDSVYAKAKIVNRGKTLCSVHGHMFIEGDDRSVALATGTFNIYPLSKIKSK